MFIGVLSKRTTGIEPAFPAWKAGALAIVLHPHCANRGGGNRTLDLPGMNRTL
jgi:hypothetical protein